MKSLSIVIICLAAISASGQATSSSTFFAQDGQKFWVILDGIKQNDKADANVKVTGLVKPNYRVKIIFADNTIPAMDQNMQTVGVDDKHMDVTYNIRKDKKGKMVMRVSSFSESTATAPTPGQAVVPFHAEETKPANVTTTTTTTKQDVNVGTDRVGSSQSINTPEGNVRMDMNMGATGGGINVNDGTGGGVNMNINMSGMGMDGTTGSTTTTTTRTTTTTTYTNSGTGASGTPANPPVDNSRPTTPPPTTPVTPPANSGCVYPASSGDIGNVKASIEKQSFSSNKMNVAKTFIKNKCVSVSQIKDIMGLFSFEGDKLEFAKAAYDRCSDKENYYQVSDAFTFSSSNDELTDYINSK